MSTYLLVDLGYFLHFRYYAALSWFKRAHKDKDYSELEIQENAVFQKTLLKRVRDSIIELLKKYNIDNNNVIFCKDCSQCEIWRKELMDAYKVNRVKKDIKLAFSLIYKEIEMLTKNGIGILLKYPNAEADDIVYCVREYILNEINKDSKCIIVASDNDYYQICDDSTSLIRLDSRSAMNKSLGDPKKDLLYKVILGDKSDNIGGIFPKCGHKTALKYVNDPDLFQSEMDKNKVYRERYDHNMKMIDMSKMPLDIKLGILDETKRYLVIHE